jgi:hypothetical protein
LTQAGRMVECIPTAHQHFGCDDGWACDRIRLER